VQLSRHLVQNSWGEAACGISGSEQAEASGSVVAQAASAAKKHALCSEGAEQLGKGRH
jgi:hypothetical protein